MRPKIHLVDKIKQHRDKPGHILVKLFCRKRFIDQNALTYTKRVNLVDCKNCIKEHSYRAYLESTRKKPDTAELK